MLTKLRENLIETIQQSDLCLLLLCATANLYGIVLIFTATRHFDSGRDRYCLVQFAAMLIGIAIYFALSIVDLQVVIKRWKWILLFDIVLIALLRTPLGRATGGNLAWLKFPGIPVMIGPAEYVKIGFCLLLAKQLAWLHEERHDLKSLPAAIMVGGHAIALCGYYYVVSGDMGNALVFLFIFMCMSFAAGFALRWFVLLIGAGAGAVAVAWRFGLVHGYMKNRILTLFDHELDPQGVGWHQGRSLLALGSGGLFGTGFLKGAQTQGPSYALPARHTDFIFSVAGEELGLIGCMLIIVLLALIFARILYIARHAQTTFESNVCVGIAAMLMFQALVNIGMCLYVMPVIGITLPFFSYGGSSIVTLYISMGLVSGVKNRASMKIRALKYE